MYIYIYTYLYIYKYASDGSASPPRPSRRPAPSKHNNHFTEMCSGSEAGSYLRIIDLCITQL